jgi:hypothetical protein
MKKSPKGNPARSVWRKLSSLQCRASARHKASSPANANEAPACEPTAKGPQPPSGGSAVQAESSRHVHRTPPDPRPNRPKINGKNRRRIRLRKFRPYPAKSGRNRPRKRGQETNAQPEPRSVTSSSIKPSRRARSLEGSRPPRRAFPRRRRGRMTGENSSRAPKRGG